MLCNCICSIIMFLVFFFKQKTAYEMRISDWSSDVCSSDLEFHLIEANEADFIVLLTSDAIALFRRDEFMGQSERLSMDSHMRLMRAALESGKPLSWSSVKDGIDHARANLLIAAYATGVAEAAQIGRAHV